MPGTTITPPTAGEPAAARPGAAADSEIAREVAELNLSGLSLLQRTLRELKAMPACQPQPLPPALRATGTRWLDLGHDALARLAVQPFVLFDGGFDRAGRWSEAEGVRDTQASASVTPGGEAAAAYARTVFAYAWYLARSAPTQASLVFGMAGATAAAIGSRSLSQVERLARAHPDWLSLRWDDDPQIWARLIDLAVSPDPRSIRELQRRALQRFAGTRWIAADGALHGVPASR